MRHRSLISLESLAEDVLIQVFEFLNVDDIVAVRNVSTKLAAVTRLSTVWRTALKHCVNRALPIPGTGPELFPMPSQEIEWRTRRAHYLDKLWTAHDPFTFRKYQFNAHSGGIDQVYLLPGGRCLLTRRGSRVMCWHLGPTVDDVDCIDEWRYEHGLVSTIVMDDEDPTHIILAVGAWEIDKPTLILGLQPLDQSNDLFTQLASTRTTGRPMAIHRNILVFNNGQFVGEGDELGLNLVDWRSGQTAFIPRQDNHMGPCIDVTFHLDILVVVWHWSIELWTVPGEVGVVSPELLQRFIVRSPMRGPIGFTTCLPRALASDHSKVTTEGAMEGVEPCNNNKPPSRLKEYPPLTIISSQRPSSNRGLSQIMLQQIPERELPVHFPNAPHLHHVLHFHLVRAVTADIPDMVPVLQVGPSGRGVYATSNRGCLFAFGPVTVISPFGHIRGTPDLEHPRAVSPSQSIVPEWACVREIVAFDDSMGRVVLGDVLGGVTVLDCM